MKRSIRRILLVAGLILVILGIASLFVPIPQEKEHGFEVGNLEVGVTREVSETIDPRISAVIIVLGVGGVAAGLWK
ncbi:MAG: hypothetical protein R3338_06775 [Thermoanaerobaculia bacterium]|nr:hypothetical protein [Thermoanaerobaculia bacterium]